MVNPQKFQVICESVRKTDRNDTRALTFSLSKDILPETRLRSAAGAELASPVHTGDLPANKIHARHLRLRAKLKKESLTSRKHLRELNPGPFTPLGQVERGHCAIRLCAFPRPWRGLTVRLEIRTVLRRRASRKSRRSRGSAGVPPHVASRQEVPRQPGKFSLRMDQCEQYPSAVTAVCQSAS